MLFPRSHTWTRIQRWLIAGAVLVGLMAFSALVYSYERHHRGPDESFFVGTWRGEYVPHSLYLGPREASVHFSPDHTYEGLTAGGHWHAGGDFLYLRLRLDQGGDPYDTLETWHIDSMTAAELRMHFDSMHVVLRRVE